jgi:PAS domain S-box-containing protein
MELTLDVRHEARVDDETRSGGLLAAGLPPVVEVLIQARTGDAVFVVGPDYRIVHWDYRAESLTGLLAEETLGKPCYEVLQGECEGGMTFCAQECSVMQLAQAGRPVSCHEMQVSTRSGGRRWVNVSNLFVHSEEGPYLVHLMRDSQRAHETLEMARGLIQLSTPAPTCGDVPELTSRQLEVLGGLAEGKTAKGIGQDLFLSEATVRNHIRSLLQTLGAHSQLEALSKAYKMGLLSS